MLNFLQNWITKKRKTAAYDVEELRRDFKARYQNFKNLLKANNQSLEIMTAIEETLRGEETYNMSYVRSQCTRVSTNVWRIIKNLNALSQNKYERLDERYADIQTKIRAAAFADPPLPNGPMVIPLHEADLSLVDQIGPKMANLGEIKNRVKLKVPEGFILTAQAYQRFMKYNDLEPEIEHRYQTVDLESLDQLYHLSSSLQQLIIAATVPEDLEAAISEQIRLLEEIRGREVNVAMRSSALGEDLSGRSFAGQYRSELNVSGHNISLAYKEIVASKYGLPAMTYRLNRGIPDRDVAMCVGCMIMVDAVSSGVAYSRHPLNIQDRSVIINSVWGLPKPVVDGSASTDLFVVSRDSPPAILKREIALKEKKFVCYPDEGVCRLDASGDEESRKPSLDDGQVLELTGLARRLEEYYGSPQDIEWSIEPDGSIVLLQSRPLKQTESQEEQIPPELADQDHDVILHGGVSASSGIAAGPVFWVRRDADSFKFPKGAVLVTAQALPRWAILLNRAAAVVTGQGSITGHLANVAREFGVPGIFGLKEGIEGLENGQTVTVDADGLRIYKGRLDDILQRQLKPKNLMEGSRVYTALQDAAQHITPLNLLDPDAPEFKPQNCRTLHDITRFCHEKAVQEMFQFGKEHHFPERSSKQLYYDVPMQWWVLNLDDGFKEEVSGKYVRMENIASIPMLALWDGIKAVPWEGPPSLDTRGFISVMFQATANRELTHGVRSRYADRNYFLISKNYCSLSSRLGFHFSIVEALVGDRTGENYISFQYKGGAADIDRRVKRLQFLSGILEENGFLVSIRNDSLIARVEGLEEAIMKKKLEILGYLTIHTRQIDMIMSNNAAVEYYRSKMQKDILELVGVSERLERPVR